MTWLSPLLCWENSSQCMSFDSDFGEITYIQIEKINTLTLFRILYPKPRNPKKNMFTHFQKKRSGPSFCVILSTPWTWFMYMKRDESRLASISDFLYFFTAVIAGWPFQETCGDCQRIPMCCSFLGWAISGIFVYLWPGLCKDISEQNR